MRPKVSKAPLLLFLAMFVSPAVLVPLLANDAQRLRTLASNIGLEVGKQPQARAWQGPLLPQAEPPPAPQSMLDRLTDGAPPVALSESLLTVKPQARCDGLAALHTRLTPQFVLGEGGEWECTALVELDNEDSLFLHVRGDQLLLRTFRVKLNLLAGREQQSLVLLSARAMNAFLPVDITFVDRKLNEAIESGDNSTFILGYGEISIRPERGGERRYNILMRPDLIGSVSRREFEFSIPQRLWSGEEGRGEPGAGEGDGL
jgi:hypothetical protein